MRAALIRNRRWISLAYCAVGAVCAWSAIAPALASSFSDVSDKDNASPAIEFMKAQGLMQGYSDGTFRPTQPVKRAEALKILVSAKLTSEQIASFTKTSYTDVPANAWYRPYVEAALEKLGLIDGPPKATQFHGDQTIHRAEFLKLLFKSQGADTSAFGEITLPLALDVTDPGTWFYPLMRYAVSSSVIQINADGKLHPDEELTRAELANEVYRFAMYQAGKRTQSLLTEEENDLMNVLQMLQNKDLTDADLASGRALVAARGALQSKPSTPIVQAAVKIAESFRSIVRAYQAGAAGNLNDTLSIAKDAWASAEKAKQISPSLADLAARVQTISKDMADQARTMLQAETSSSSKAK